VLHVAIYFRVSQPNCSFLLIKTVYLLTVTEEKLKEAPSRFNKVKDKDYLELAQKSIPTNTKNKATWAFRLYERWATWSKNLYGPKDEWSMVSDILMSNTELEVIRDEDLDDVICQFIGEVRKEGGERYPGKTLHEIVSRLQKYLEMKGRKVQFFAGVEFEKLRKSLDIEMKMSSQNKLGLKPKQALVISEAMENLFGVTTFLVIVVPKFF
jgi:hypothetical protein